MTVVRYSSHMPATAEELFEFHMDVDNLAQISPPLPRYTLLSAPTPTVEGAEQRFRLSVGPRSITWRARITAVAAGAYIEDVQEAGPFRSWKHRHSFAPEGAGSRLTDTVRFRSLPGALGSFMELYSIAPGIWLMFAWRHRRTRALLARKS